MKWFEKIHPHAIHCSRKLKRAEYEFIVALQAVDGKKVYRKLGYASLHDCATKALKIPDGSAYGYIHVARKAVRMPKIAVALREEKVTVSQVRRVLKKITPETQDLWIEKAATLKQRELEAEMNPDKKVKLELRMDLILEDKFQRARKLLSQKQRKVVSLEETLSELLEAYLEENDPVRIATRRAKSGTRRKISGVVRSTSPQSSVAGQDLPESPGQAIRRAIPQAIKNAVYLRDKGTCSYLDTDGKRCGSDWFVDLHHIKPRSQGGQHILENLVTVCGAHHRLLHGQNTGV